MKHGQKQDISIAITGSGGSGVVAAGELLLGLAGKLGYLGLMRRAYGPQIRGGESAALLRLGNHPLQCMDDCYDVLVALDWQNIDRFAAEIPLSDHSLVIADPNAGEIPQLIAAAGARVEPLHLKVLQAEVEGGRTNMLVLGALAAWLDFDAGLARGMIEETFCDKGETIVASSLAAFNKGFAQGLGQQAPPAITGLADSTNHWQLTGNEACGLGALRGGIRFTAAYPITPASEMLEWLAPRLERLGGSLLQAEDELASINMVIGASYGGVPAMTATSGPGLALMLEGLGLAVASETPALVVNVMRGGPSTGIPTKSEQTDLNIAVYGMHGDAPHLVLGALDTGDCVFTTEWAVRLAEAMQCPAIVLSDQGLAQSRALLQRPRLPALSVPPRKAAANDGSYQRYVITEDGVSPMALPGEPGTMYTADGLEHAPSGKPSSAAADHSAQLEKRQLKLEQFEYGDFWAESEGKGDTAILTWGSSTGACREARQRLLDAGIETRLLALRLLLPAQVQALTAALVGVQRVVVVEQSHSRQFYRYLRAHYDIDAQIDVLARPGPLPITPGEVVSCVSSKEQTHVAS